MNGQKHNQFIYIFLIIVGFILFCPTNTYAATKNLATCKYKSESGNAMYQTVISTDFSLENASSKIVLYDAKTINKKIIFCNWEKTEECNFFNPSTQGSVNLKKIAKSKSGQEACPKYIQIFKSRNYYDVLAYYEKDESYQSKISDTMLQTLKLVYSDISYTTLTLYKEESGNSASGDTGKDNLHCYNILGNGEKGSLAELLQQIFNYIKVLGPILVLVFSSLDFTKTILSSDDEGMKKAQKKLGIRLICAVLIYFLPTLVTLLINLVFGTSSNQTCGIN